MKIIWSPTAVTKLSDIVTYISQDNPIQAEIWADKVFNAVERLSDYPNSGRIVPEVNAEKVREIILGNYRIIYEITDIHIAIITVRHCKRLIDKDEIQNTND